MPVLNIIKAAGGGPSLPAFTVFYGERLGSMAAPSGDPLTAANSFDSYTTGVTIETWESKTLGAVGGSITSTHGGGLTGTFVPDHGEAGVNEFYDDSGFNDINVGNVTTNGRFNTTSGGSKFIETALPVIYTPSASVAGWGGYFTDAGDFSRPMTIELTDDDDTVTTYPIGHTLNGTDTLFFWGFIDPSGTLYKRIRILSEGDYTPPEFGDPGFTIFNDFFGLDDVRALVLAQVT